MLNIISSIILVVSLGTILVILLRKQSVLRERFESSEPDRQKRWKGLDKKLEEWDEKINKLMEFFLRRFRTTLLKGDNLISRWLFSLRRNNSRESSDTFFLGESVNNESSEEEPAIEIDEEILTDVTLEAENEEGADSKD